MQPMIRTKLTHDPASMEGQSYAPIVVALLYDVSTSGSGVHDLYTVPAGFWLEKAQGIVLEGLDDGTVDFGLDGDTDALIDNTEWTATNTGAIASSQQTTAPDGLYFAALDVLSVETTLAASGKVMFLLWLYDLNAIQAQGLHNSI
jgi:hypothetical protein